MSSYQAHSQELLKSGPRENYYRAPTDIDLLMENPPAPIHKWRAAGLDRLERTVKSCQAYHVSPKVVAVNIRSWLYGQDQQDGIESDISYLVYGNGEIEISNVVEVNEHLPFIPRVGVELILPGDLGDVSWYGRGPHENYVDRKIGAAVGHYTSTVAEQFTPYVYPSECGGKEDVRWLALTGSSGVGLMFMGQELLHFDALHYSIQDLAEAKHLDALHTRDEVILHLDGWHMGVGGDDGWWSQVHEEFKIYPGIYRYAFNLKPISPDDDPAAVARTKIEGSS